MWLHTDGLTDDEVRGAFLRPVADVSEAVSEAVAHAVDRSGSGRRARVGVLPYGPLTVASAN